MNRHIESISVAVGVFFFLTSGLTVDVTSSLDSCLYFLKQYRIEELKMQSHKLDQEYLKTLLLVEAEYLESGTQLDSGLIFIDQHEKKELATAQLLYANYLERIDSAVDSSIYRLYFDAFNTSKELGDTLLANIILTRINHFYFRIGEEMDQFGHYLQVTKQYARDSIDRFWYYYYAVGREMKLMERGEQSNDTNRMHLLFEEMERIAPSDFFKAYGYQQKAIYYDAFLSQKQQALDWYTRAKALYQSIPYHYSLKGVPSILFNEAILNYETGQYRTALSYFFQHQKKEQNAVYRMYGYQWIYKCYEGLEQIDSAYFYFKKMTTLKEEIDRGGTALQVNKIEFNYNLEQKEKELSNALAESSKHQDRSRTFLIGVLLFALLNVLAYFLVRKLRKKTGSLEEEKSETIVRLEELKNIVTKDFILLNDNTKVYVSELVYIKSDDHYLHVFLENDRSHFVRGRLKTMNQNLPPNFKQCHRSYIVNENYITKVERSTIIMSDGSKVPISKSYKEFFG